MDDTDQTTAYRLTITVDDADLPVNEDVRHALLDDLSAEIRDLLGEHSYYSADNARSVERLTG